MISLRFKHVRFILYVAALILPFTALRFGDIGFGEILIAVSFILFLFIRGGRFKAAKELRPIIQFWFLYLIVIFLGFSYNVIVLGHVTGTYNGAFFDFSSYCVVLASIVLLSDESLYAGIAPKVFFENIFILWAIAFTLLFISSLFVSEIFGFSILYYDKFSPLVDNVHQAAMITSTVPFIMFFMAVDTKSLIKKVAFVVFGALFVVMAIKSDATKAIMSVVVGAAVSLFFYFSQLISVRAKRGLSIAYYFLLSIIGIFLIVVFFDLLVALLIDFFIENDGSSGREDLYSLGVELVLGSPFFGYGPGPHLLVPGVGLFSDAHNTFLTILLQGGGVAVFIFLFSLLRLISTLSLPYFLAGTLSAVSMYFLGGDILRRLPIWIIIVGVIFLAKSQASYKR